MEGINDTLSKIPKANTQTYPKRYCKHCNKEIDYFDTTNLCGQQECVKKERTANIETLMIKAEMPLHFRKIVTDRKIIIPEGRGVYCYGGVGTGKTVYICSLAREYLIQGKSVKFWSTLGLILSLYDKYKKPDEEIKKYIDENTITPDVLILDDLGSEKLTEYVRTTFFYILNEREAREKITIITSNLSLDELDNHLGCRIGSRIAGCCEVIKFTGKDKRLK